MLFPTTLRDIAPQGGVVHVFGEYKGRRYHVAAAVNHFDADQLRKDYAKRYGSGVEFYTKDRSDSTQIDGAALELQNTFHIFDGR